jgi:C4-dicarboxylate transporter DctM subunit
LANPLVSSEVAEALPGDSARHGQANLAWTTWRTLLGSLTWLAEAILVIGLVAELLIQFVSVWSRYLANRPVSWTSDAATIGITLITFVGAAVAIRRGQTISLRFFLSLVPKQVAAVLEAAGVWLTLGLAALVLDESPTYLQNSLDFHTPVLQIPDFWISVWVVVGFALISLYTIDDLLRRRRGQVVRGFCVAALVPFAVIGYEHLGAKPSPVVLMGVAAVIAIVCAAQISVVLAIAAFAYIFGTGTITPITALPTLEQGVSSYIMIAIPFFLLAGGLLEVGGLGKPLIDVIRPVSDRLRGGLLVAEVIAIYVFSGISGSKLADMAAVGSSIRSSIDDAKIPRHESAAVLAASAAMSETVPPSLAILVLASITPVSVASLFLAGLIPAAVVALTLIAGIIVRGYILPLPRVGGAGFRGSLRALPRALPALLLPIALIGGIVGGVGTPSEVASFAGVYGLIVATVMYRKLRAGAIVGAIRDAAVLSGATLFILAAAALLSKMLTIDGIPQRVGVWAEGLGSTPLFWVITLCAIVAFGMILEGLPALLILGPMLLPIAMSLGINPLQYSIAMIVAMGKGAFAPPLGAGFTIAAAIMGTTPEKTFRPSLFYTSVTVAGLVAIVVFPQLTLWLPHQFGYR